MQGGSFHGQHLECVLASGGQMALSPSGIFFSSGIPRFGGFFPSRMSFRSAVPNPAGERPVPTDSWRIPGYFPAISRLK